jgi:hypothetical protein
MPDDREMRMPNGREMWLSTRAIRRAGAGDPEWDDFIRFRGRPQLREVRSIDSWRNPCVTGNYPVYSVGDVWDRLELLPEPARGREYHLLFMDALAAGDPPEHLRLKLLGYDLSDETWTSSLLNCCLWQGELEAIAGRTGENGLLGFDDAKLAQALLPNAWPGDPHGIVTVWALFEIVPDVEAGAAEPGVAPACSGIT